MCIRDRLQRVKYGNIGVTWKGIFSLADINRTVCVFLILSWSDQASSLMRPPNGKAAICFRSFVCRAGALETKLDMRTPVSGDWSELSKWALIRLGSCGASACIAAKKRPAEASLSL